MRHLIILTMTACAAAADKPIDPPKPPRTAPLSEVHQLRLENLYLKFQAAQREIERIKAANDETIAEVCKAAGFMKCAIDPEKRVVTEAKP